MPMPRSVTRIRRGGIEFVSSVDRAQYTIKELSRAALKDVAKLIRRRMLDELRKLPGMRRHRRLWRSTQYWVRRIEADLQVGFKHDSWYGAQSELGTSGQPARHILRDTVMANINEIRLIEAQYLSAVEDELRAQGLIDEREETGDEQGP